MDADTGKFDLSLWEKERGTIHELFLCEVGGESNPPERGRKTQDSRQRPFMVQCGAWDPPGHGARVRGGGELCRREAVPAALPWVCLGSGASLPHGAKERHRARVVHGV